MKTNRKTIKMPVRYLMNAVLVALLFVGLSFLTQNVLSTYQNKVLLTVGSQISQCFFIRHVYNPFLKNRCRTGSIVFGNLGNLGNPAEIPVSIGINTLYHNMQENTSLFEKKQAFSK